MPTNEEDTDEREQAWNMALSSHLAAIEHLFSGGHNFVILVRQPGSTVWEVLITTDDEVPIPGAATLISRPRALNA